MPAAARPHLSGAIGLWARGRRQSAAWRPHIRHTSALIETAASRLPRHRTVVVLGSGPLFDVPLATLAQGFTQVVLVDLVHLLGARWQVRRHPNVRCLWRDLSSLADPDPLAFLAAIPDLDWVISLNLVSQLGVGAPDGAERQVIDGHLAALSALPCPVTLVTDIAYHVQDRHARTTEYLDLLYGRTLPAADASWSWTVAPFGEESRITQRLHTVVAYADWHAASAGQNPLTHSSPKPSCTSTSA